MSQHHRIGTPLLTDKGAGTLTVTSSFEWTNGNMMGTGTTFIPGTLSMDGTGSENFITRTLSIGGSAAISSGGQLNGSSSALVLIQQGAVFSIDNASQNFNDIVGARPLLENAGRLVLDPGAAATVSLGWNYQQDATGELDIELGGTNSGQWDVLNVGGTAILNGTLSVSLLPSFTPPPTPLNTFTILNASGTISGTFSKMVNNGTTLRPSYHFAPNSVSLGFNHVPVAMPGTATVNEDATVSGTVSATDADGDPLTYQVVSTSPFGGVQLNATTGVYTYVPVPNVPIWPNLSVAGTFTFKANDTFNDSNVATMTVTINFVNDPPSFTAGANQSVTANSGPQTVQGWATNFSPGPSNESAQTVKQYNIVSNDNPTLFSAVPAIDTSGTLTYTPGSVPGLANVTINVQDNGGTANGGMDTSAPQTFTITVTTPPPPVANDGSITTTEETTASGNLVATNSPNTTLAYSIVTNGANGTASVDAATGVFSYAPATGVPIWPNPAVMDTFTFDVFDGFSYSNVGTITVTINFVNDPPSFTAGPNQSVTANSGPQSVPNWATNISPGPANETAQTVGFNIVSNDNTALFSVGPAIDASGNLTYTPANNATGVANITINAQDDGGTANGGVDTSPPQTFSIMVTTPPPPVANDGSISTNEETLVSGNLVATNAPNTTLTYSIVTNGANGAANVDSTTGAFSYRPNTGIPVWPNPTATDTFTFDVFDGFTYSNVGTITVTINFVNDAPTFSTFGNPPSVQADSGPQTFLYATAISAGPANEAAQSVNFIVTPIGNAAAMFSTQPAIDAASGILTYAPAIGAVGTAMFSVALQDNGGTANGGMDTSVPQNLTINIIPPPPPVAQNSSISTNEETPFAGNLMAAGAPNTTLAYSIAGNPIFGAVVMDSATGAFTYTPNTGIPSWPNLTETDYFYFDVFDGFTYSNTSIINVTINFVNDPPSFTAGANQTVAANAGAQGVAWATNISPGPANESAQSVNFIVTNTNNTTVLFLAQPAININGILAYTPAPGGSGTATFSVTLHDNGGTLNGGMNTSAAEPLTITVTSAGVDQPVANAGANQSAQITAPGCTDANVTLDGSQSNDPDGETLTYLWTGDFAGGTATGVTPQVTFTSVGVHTVTLKVTDPFGHFAMSTMTVTVTYAPPYFSNETPPSITAGTHDPTGTIVPIPFPVVHSCDPATTLTATAQGPNNTTFAVQPTGTKFPVGMTTVTFTATDSEGQVATEYCIVTVLLNPLNIDITRLSNTVVPQAQKATNGSVAEIANPTWTPAQLATAQLKLVNISAVGFPADTTFAIRIVPTIAGGSVTIRKNGVVVLSGTSGTVAITSADFSAAWTLEYNQGGVVDIALVAIDGTTFADIFSDTVRASGTPCTPQIGALVFVNASSPAPAFPYDSLETNAAHDITTALQTFFILANVLVALPGTKEFNIPLKGNTYIGGLGGVFLTPPSGPPTIDYTTLPTVDAQQKGRVMNAASINNCTVGGLQIVNGKVSGNGAGLSVSAGSNFLARRVWFLNNVAPTSNGGGLWIGSHNSGTGYSQIKGQTQSCSAS